MIWLQSAPRIKLFSDTNKRKPYPLSWNEQEKLLSFLPIHLSDMALLAVNTGCRDGEICSLQWKWYVPVPELNTADFITLGDYVKNSNERLVVLNSIVFDIVYKQPSTGSRPAKWLGTKYANNRAENLHQHTRQCNGLNPLDKLSGSWARTPESVICFDTGNN